MVSTPTGGLDRPGATDEQDLYGEQAGRPGTHFTNAFTTVAYSCSKTCCR